MITVTEQAINRIQEVSKKKNRVPYSEFQFLVEDVKDFSIILSLKKRVIQMMKSLILKMFNFLLIKFHLIS